MEKLFCAYKKDTYYIDKVGKIVDEGKLYYIVRPADGFYWGGSTINAIKKDNKQIKFFETTELANEWIKKQNYYYSDSYPDGLPPSITKEYSQD